MLLYKHRQVVLARLALREGECTSDDDVPYRKTIRKWLTPIFVRPTNGGNYHIILLEVYHLKQLN